MHVVCACVRAWSELCRWWQARGLSLWSSKKVASFRFAVQRFTLPIKYIELSKEKMWFIPVSLSVEVTAISAIHMMGKFLIWTSPYSSKFRPKHVATQIYVYNKRLSSDRRRYTVTVCNFVTRCCEKQIALLTVVSCNTNRVLLALKFVLPSWCVFIIFSVTTAALQLGTARSLQHCPQSTDEISFV